MRRPAQVLRMYYLHTKQDKDSLAMAFKLDEHLSEEAKNVPNGGHLGVLPCEVREKGLYPKVPRLKYHKLLSSQKHQADKFGSIWLRTSLGC